MKRIFAVVALVWTTLAGAEAPPEFVKLRDDPNTRVLDQGLSGFLDKYIGDCTDPLESDACKANAKAFRAKVNGHRYYMIIGEDAVNQLSPGPYDPRGTMILNVTPFFPGGGYALTQGAPRGTDAHGNPVLPLIRVKAKVPEDWNGQTLSRMISMHAFRLQVIFEPQDVWTLSKKGGGKIQGVKAKIVAVLVSGARTGTPLALYTAR